MLRRHLIGALREMGWTGRNLDADLRAFQTGWALGAQLTVDGKNGPNTREAIRLSLRELRAGRCDLSPHFRFSEFRCRCGGNLPGCRGILVQRGLALGLERMRVAAGGAIDVVSGYRCEERNRRVGGASESQHLYGGAGDVAYKLSDTQTRRLGVFSGIGRSRRTRKVRHVDVRHLTGHNSTGGTPARPTVWDYAQ